MYISGKQQKEEAPAQQMIYDVFLYMEIITPNQLAQYDHIYGDFFTAIQD